MAKVLGDSSAAGLVAVGAVAVGLVAPEHHGRAAEQIEGVARQPRVAIVARQHHRHALPTAIVDSNTMIDRDPKSACSSLTSRRSKVQPVTATPSVPDSRSAPSLVIPQSPPDGSP